MCNTKSVGVCQQLNVSMFYYIVYYKLFYDQSGLCIKRERIHYPVYCITTHF
jgi:hypothetical protein